MKKKFINNLLSAAAVAIFVLIAFGSGNDSSSDSDTGEDNSSKYKNYDLTTIKKGNTFIFQNQCKGGCDKIVLEFLENYKVKFKLNHVWEKKVGSSNIQMSENYEGIYDYSIVDTKNYKLDNQYWNLYNKGILLSNDDYGYDNGSLYLYKKYLISNVENSENVNEKMSPNIYQWLDPINYPGRNQEFDGLGIILKEVK